MKRLFLMLFIIIFSFLFIGTEKGFSIEIILPPPSGVYCGCEDDTYGNCRYNPGCALNYRCQWPHIGGTEGCIVYQKGFDCECGDKCKVGNVPQTPCCRGSGYGTSSCDSGYTKCQNSKCPTNTDNNFHGGACTISRGFVWGIIGEHAGCFLYYGKWDNSKKACVECDGPIYGRTLGDGNGFFAKLINENEHWEITCRGENNFNCDFYKKKEDCTKGDAAIHCKWTGSCTKKNCDEIKGEDARYCKYGCKSPYDEKYGTFSKVCDESIPDLCDNKIPGKVYAEDDGNGNCMDFYCYFKEDESVGISKTEYKVFYTYEYSCSNKECINKTIKHYYEAEDQKCVEKTTTYKEYRIDNCVCDDDYTNKGVSCNENHVETTIVQGFSGTPDNKCEAAAYGSTITQVKNSNCLASLECDEKNPGQDFCNEQCLLNCSKLNGAYPDSLNDSAKGVIKCEGFDYGKYTSAYQVREYKNDNPCKCEVTYDSWIENVSVNGISQGIVQVFQNYHITADIILKNVGSKDQTDWFVGVEFWNVSDFNNPWNTRDQKGRIDLYYSAKDNTGGCINERGSCPEDATCKLVSSDKTIKPQKNVIIQCTIPPSFYPVTTGNQRVMIWVHERISGLDADKDGKEEWWDDALARTNKGSGLEDWPALVTVNISEPFSIGKIKSPTGVIVNSLVTVTWQLWETLESPEKCGKEQYRCHTNLHCFPPGIIPPAEDDIKSWIDDCDPYVGRPSTSCVSSTMEDQVQETYEGKIFVNKAGNWTCRIHLRNKNRDVFSHIFQIEVKDIPNEPYCVVEPSSKTVYSDRKANFTVKLKNGKDTSITWKNVITFNKLHKQCADYLSEEIITVDNLVDKGLSKDGISLECYYPPVQNETETYFKVAIPYQIGSEVKSTACFSDVKVLPPLPCNITSFQLLGTISGTSTVRNGEIVKAVLQGDNCEGKTAQIKDLSTNQLMCTCTFSGATCVNQSCFIAPEKLGIYTYEVSASPPSLNASIFVFSYGLNILSENYGSYSISWKLLPEWPTKEKEFFLFLIAKDSSGNPLTPSTHSFLYTYPGYTTSQYSFSYFPNLYLNVGKFWVANENLPKSYNIPFDSITISGVKFSAREVVGSEIIERMDSLIVPGSIIIEVKQTDWNKEQKRLAILVSSSDQNANLSYRIWKVSDLSLYKQGDFTKYGSSFQAEATVDLDQFFFEILANSKSTGGKVLAFGLEKPNFLLNVTPSAISGESYANKTFKANLTLKNVGNSEITDLLVEASDEIKQFTSISFERRIGVGETKNVSLTFEIGEKNFNGKIFIKYAGKTISVPVSISIKETPKISVSPLEISISATSGQRFEQKITITNNGKVTVTIYSIEVYGVENVSSNFYGTDTIQASKSKTYSITGTLFKTGEYEGYVRIESDAGTKTVSLKVTITSILPSCGNGKCESTKGETKDNCCLDCGCPSGKICDRTLNLCVVEKCGNGICEEGENSTSCPKDCYCGDGVCNVDENSIKCPKDCPTLKCDNDGICEEFESYPNCLDCSGFFCGNKICEPGEEISCVEDCPEVKSDLENKISSLSSSLSSLEEDMSKLGDKVNSTLWLELSQIKSLLNEAKNSFKQGDYSTALSKYNEAYRRYQDLREVINDLLQKFMKPSTDLTTILIILVVVAIIAGVFVVLWKFGYLKIKLWKKKEEEEYYY